ncbi:MAG: LUD domain-containing protein [Spongiibacteraceae bacterium]|nr:LUD domain-containing protein [Spongiibacteraceae bacterium]MBN4055657.1 LUD domain-containing protein [bacterium AH-315-K03]
MSKQRSAIINRIQQGLARTDNCVDISQRFAQLTGKPNPPVQPTLPGKTLEAFTTAATQNAAEVHYINHLQALPQWLNKRAEQLAQHPPLALSPELSQAPLSWPPFESGDYRQQTNCWGITQAYAGIAETGTVVCVSEDCPSSFLFLVERLIVVLDAADIVAYQEQLWQSLQQRFKGRLPRAVNLITGPSRTADVEQQIQLGAHGPRWTDYVIVNQ